MPASPTLTTSAGTPASSAVWRRFSRPPLQSPLRQPHAPISITQFTPRGLREGWWPVCGTALQGSSSIFLFWKSFVLERKPRLLVAAGSKPRPLHRTRHRCLHIVTMLPTVAIHIVTQQCHEIFTLTSYLDTSYSCHPKAPHSTLYCRHFVTTAVTKLLPHST